MSRGRECVRGGHRKKVTTISWNCNGLWLATGGADKEILIHKHTNEKELVSSKTPKVMRLTAHKDTIRTLAFNTTDPYMLASSSDDKYIYFWNLQGAKSTAKASYTYKLGGVCIHMAWSSAGNYVLCLCNDNTFILLDRLNPKKTFSKTMDFRLSEAFWAGPNDEYVVFANEKKFSIYNWTPPKSLTGPHVSKQSSGGQVKSITSDPNNEFIVTSNSDGTVSVWSTDNLTCMASLKFLDRACSMTKVRVSHNSKFLSSAGDDNKIFITNVKNEIPIAKIDHRCSSLSMAWNPKFLVLAYTAMPPNSDNHYHRSDNYAQCRLWQPPGQLSNKSSWKGR